MQRVTAIEELRRLLAARSGSLGLVPTMGALHQGHLALVSRARSECDRVAVSIFVNPTQFGPNEDLSRYPRDLERDLRLLEPLGVDVVWTPTPEEMYPTGFETWVTVEGVGAPYEGKQRPGHFRGVATVVAKLFNAVGPDRAYFGQKDAQQAALVRRMVRDLAFPLEIVVCPTVREADGLALSSRNAYLSAEERRAATVLYRGLSAARSRYEAGEREAEALRAAVAAAIAAEPLARLEYVGAADPETLEDLERVAPGSLLVVAARVGGVRLIDNLVLPPL
jgi:pantoate--beta-alanine ligase